MSKIFSGAPRRKRSSNYEQHLFQELESLELRLANNKLYTLSTWSTSLNICMILLYRAVKASKNNTLDDFIAFYKITPRRVARLADALAGKIKEALERSQARGVNAQEAITVQPAWDRYKKALGVARENGLLPLTVTSPPSAASTTTEPVGTGSLDGEK